jgi:hypothetical protein
MVNSRGEFTGAHNPAVPHWSQIQHLARRMMPCETYDALLPRRSGVRASGLSVALGEAILRDDHRVPAPYVDAGSFDLSSASLWGRPGKFVVDNFPLSISCRPLSIRGIGIDRKLRWTGFGHDPAFGIRYSPPECGRLRPRISLSGQVTRHLLSCPP